jgi:NAD(P)-dependent dehydrogenase (short-subunit alcohol dehydrogenase family)
MPSRQLTWFITGASSGFGEIFVKQILARGDRVIATARKLSKVQHLKVAGASILELDVTASQSTLDSKVTEAIGIYGNIDVLVNNAGYAALGTIEDVSREQWMDQYNTNVFGVVNITRAIMPYFRAKKSGFVLFMGSVGGWNGSAAGGPYCSTKFALEGTFRSTLYCLTCFSDFSQGISESFLAETAHLNIKSMLVDPGYFRTSFLKEGNAKLVSTAFSDYESVTKGLFDAMKAYNGNQPGDPNKAVARIIDVVRQEGVARGRGVPSKLILGPDAVDGVRKKCKNTLEMLENWEDVSSSTNF